MNNIDNQYPSTLALLEADDEDFRLSCRSSSSKECVDEQPRGGSETGTPDHRGGDREGRAADGGDGEKLSLGGG